MCFTVWFVALQQKLLDCSDDESLSRRISGDGLRKFNSGSHKSFRLCFEWCVPRRRIWIEDWNCIWSSHKAGHILVSCFNLLALDEISSDDDSAQRTSPERSWQRFWLRGHKAQFTHPYYHRKLPAARSQTKSHKLHNNPILLISTFSSSSLLELFPSSWTFLLSFSLSCTEMFTSTSSLRGCFACLSRKRLFSCFSPTIILFVLMCSHAPDKIFHYNGSINPDFFHSTCLRNCFQFHQLKIILIVVYWVYFFLRLCWELLQAISKLSRTRINFFSEKPCQEIFLFQLRNLLVFFLLSNSEFLIKIQKLIKICLQSICRTSFSCSLKSPWKLEAVLSTSVTCFIGELRGLFCSDFARH